MPLSTPTPFATVLADPTHPAHAAACAVQADLDAGRVRMCACMGPQCGEPYCPCEMTRRGLLPSAERLAANRAAEARWAELVASGIFANDN